MRGTLIAHRSITEFIWQQWVCLTYSLLPDEFCNVR